MVGNGSAVDRFRRHVPISRFGPAFGVLNASAEERDMRRLMLVGLVTIGLAAPALAQDKPVEINLGGGAIFPSADFKNDFNAGGEFQIGATLWARPTFGIEIDYNYARMNGPEKTITVTPTPGAGVGSPQLIQSNHQMHAVVFDAVGRSHNTDSAVNGYVLGGLGYYHRIIQLTSPAVGFTTICDPYWLVCYPAAVSVDQILGSRSSNDFGINFGGGVTFGREAKFFVEMRYAYVWGPTVNPPAGATTTTSKTTSIQYFPLMFGVRF
jgi:outer membrane protein with beta-barrel domain